MQQDYKKIFYVGLKFISDLFSVNLPLFLAALFIYDFNLREYFKSFTEVIILSSVLIAAIMSIFKLYEIEILERRDLLSRTTIALFIFFLVSYFTLVTSSYNYSWSLLLLFYILTSVFIISSRLIIFRLEKKSAAAKTVAVVGETQEIKEIITKIKAKPDDYNLKTVIANNYDENLEQQLSDEINTYFGFKWLEPTIDRLENTDILLIAYNNLDDRIKARLFNLKSSPGTKIYILPESYDPNFFDPDLTL
jgi:FlaA1/EpsC-like NDP-sugar epimerase